MTLAKLLVRALASLAVAPLVVYVRLASLASPSREDQVFQGGAQLMSLFPGLPGVYLRGAFYKWTLESCADSAHIAFGALFTSPGAVVGNAAYIGANSMIGLATIGDDVLIGSNVDILSGKGQHEFSDTSKPIRLQGGKRVCVRIGQDAWLGNSSVVMADIGDHAVVGAGSVVVDDVPDWAIVAGNPARVLKSRLSDRK